MSLSELQPREKKILLAGVVASAIMLVYFFATSGDSGKGRSDPRRLKQNQELFLSALQEYQSLRGKVEAIDQRLEKTPPDYDLYSDLVKIQETAALAPQTRKMNKEQGSGTEFYTEQYVDWELQGVYLDEVVEVLKQIQALPAFVRVSQLSLKKRFQDNTLDVSLRVTAYGKSQAKTPAGTGPAPGVPGAPALVPEISPGVPR